VKRECAPEPNRDQDRDEHADGSRHEAAPDGVAGERRRHRPARHDARHPIDRRDRRKAEADEPHVGAERSDPVWERRHRLGEYHADQHGSEDCHENVGIQTGMTNRPQRRGGDQAGDAGSARAAER
jgi:hypothetical protein